MPPPPPGENPAEVSTDLWKLSAVSTVCPFSCTEAKVSSPSSRSCTALLLMTLGSSVLSKVVLQVQVSAATHLLSASPYLIAIECTYRVRAQAQHKCKPPHWQTCGKTVAV
jgi:hypothetical protein